MSGEFTATELQTLAVAYPEFTTTTPDGRTIATVTKAEFLALVDRFPSMFKGDPPAVPGETEEQASLRQRFPTMFESKP
jgi:hypothetical protein